MDFMTFEDNRECGGEESPLFTVNEAHGDGFAILEATGEQIGVREAAKKMPVGTYVCSRCVGISLIEKTQLDRKACAVRPVAGPGTITALHFRHYKKSACHQRGESVWHKFWCGFLADELGGELEFCYPGSARRADVYVEATRTGHEVVVTNDVKAEKGAALSGFLLAGGTVFKYYPTRIDDREKIAALEMFSEDQSPGSRGRERLLGLIMDTKRTFVERTNDRKGGNGDGYVDSIRSTNSIDGFERCGTHCAHYSRATDGDQIRLDHGWCRYGGVTQAAIVVELDLCAVRNKKGAFRAPQ
jgi:hypothetical protein